MNHCEDTNHEPKETDSHKGDESCMLVEKDITIIQIDDTLNSTRQTEEDPAQDSTTDFLDDTVEDDSGALGEFQIIDQVGESESENAGSQEILEAAHLKATVGAETDFNVLKDFYHPLSRTVYFRRIMSSFARQKTSIWTLHQHRLRSPGAKCSSTSNSETEKLISRFKRNSSHFSRLTTNQSLTTLTFKMTCHTIES